jgi:hypothetical protein
LKEENGKPLELMRERNVQRIRALDKRKLEGLGPLQGGDLLNNQAFRG